MQKSCPRWRRRLVTSCLAALVTFGPDSSARAAALSDPEVDRFNVRIGTQTFSPRYHFTTNSPLVETADSIRALRSDVIKFCLGRGFSGQYGIPLPASITNLASLAAQEPSCREVLDMPFRHFLLWAYCFSAGGDAAWKNSFSERQQQREREEIYQLCSFLLTNYSNSGKSFYLGHWEGDWHLLPNYNTKVNPSSTAVEGMIQWLNTRQKAVDDALHDVPHTNVFIYHYTEVNRVRDAMLNGPANDQRLVNAVLPFVTNIDFVSWSSYDGMDLNEDELRRTLDYIEAHLPRAKASSIAGRRVIVGEYGWGGTLSSAAQEAPTRQYIQRLLPWGPRFILFWQMYDNEGRQYSLIDSNRNETACYQLHREFINRARLAVARFREQRGRLPDDAEFATLTVPMLDKPLPPMPRLAVSQLGSSPGPNGRMTLEATVTQRVYSDERARVWCFWGKSDGGTNSSAWDHAQLCGTNTRFNPSQFSVNVAGLRERQTFYFSFLASNATSQAWAPGPAQFTARPGK